MLYHNYLMNKETGEILTYSQACKEFYKTPRGYLESVFDEWEETDLQSNEIVDAPNFAKVF